MTTIQNQIDTELETTLIARKIATYVPSSLSIDDIKIGKKRIKPNKKQGGENTAQNKPFIPPSPSVSFNTSGLSSEDQVSPNVSKFAFLLGNKTRSPKKSISMTKMKYELPNVQKIGTSSKNLRPILAVSFSDFSLSKTDNGAKFSPKKAEQEQKSSQNSQRIIPEATQIESEVSD